MTDRQALISLNLIPNIGSVRLSALLDFFKSPGEVFRAKRQDLVAVMGENLGGSIAGFNRKILDEDLALAAKFGAKIITLADPEYPQNLVQIPGAPLVLYCWGQICPEDNLSLGIVGSRQASFYGLSSTEKFANELAQKKVTIVSGLARGVDTCAHRGALKAGGRTLAVIGSGLSNIYPPENDNLAKTIAESGAVISEFGMKTLPLPNNFPRRNRLISGLSLGVLVAEAARNSGALITADFALEQGREVFAFPGKIDSLQSWGTNNLIKQGAKLVTCVDDILEELNFTVNFSAKKIQPEKGLDLEDKKKQTALFDYIQNEAISFDDLMQKTAWDMGRISQSILKLQLQNLIKELPGKHFIRN